MVIELWPHHQHLKHEQPWKSWTHSKVKRERRLAQRRPKQEELWRGVGPLRRY